MAGLRDVLALQGVVPVSAPPEIETPGLRLGQITGSWITGAPPPAANDPGLTLGLLDGTWITGSPESAPAPEPEPEIQGGGGSSRTRPSRKPADIEYRERIQAIARDDDELTLILTLAMEVLE